jgi:hypothetical protein
MDKVAVEICVCMNEDGDYEVATDQDTADERMTENIGGFVRRFVKITARMSKPKAEEVEVDVPDEAGETTNIEA